VECTYVLILVSEPFVESETMVGQELRYY